jgi:hypothetical protein
VLRALSAKHKGDARRRRPADRHATAAPDGHREAPFHSRGARLL